MIKVTFYFWTLTWITISYSLSFQQILGHVPILEATIDRNDRDRVFLDRDPGHVPFLYYDLDHDLL